jgi:hypothetical protein
MQSACAVLSSVACLAVPCFSTLCHKWHDFRGKKLLNIKCVFWFSLETFLMLRRIQRDIIINVHRYSCKVPVILVKFECSLNFLDKFSKNTAIYNFTKIHPVGTEIFHADRCRADRQTDRQIDMVKLIVTFCNFANSPKILCYTNRLCLYFRMFTEQTAIMSLHNI